MLSSTSLAALCSLAVMCASALAGDELIFCTEPKIGSWGQSIKQSDMSLAWHDDAAGLVEALSETGQKFVVWSVDQSTHWDQFDELLDAAAAAGIEVFASMSAPHLGGNGANIWFGTNTDGTPVVPVLGAWVTEYARPGFTCVLGSSMEDYVACEASYIAQWRDRWTLAAKTLAQIATTEPALVGFVIDDFDGYVESADFPHQLLGRLLTRDDVQQIYDACHQFDTPAQRFEFWPTVYNGSAARLISPNGHILGVIYGVKLYDGDDGLNCSYHGDEMRVTLQFDVPIPTLLFEAHLQYFHTDSRGVCSPLYAYKRVLLNGVEVRSAESFAGDQGIQFDRVSLSGLLIPDAINEITFVMDAESPSTCCTARCNIHNGCSSTGVWWYIWGATLEFTEPGYPTSIEPIAAAYETSTDSQTYAITTGCAPRADDDGDGDGVIELANDWLRVPWLAPADQLPDDSVLGRSARWLVSAPSTPYLIRDLVDGIVTPFYDMRTTPTEDCGGTIVPSYSYDAEEYQALLSRLKFDLGSGKLMSMHRGIPGASTYDLDVLESQLEVAASVADRSGLWSMPIGVHYVDEERGVFARRDSTNPNFQFMAYYPGRQSSLDGWHQEFVINPWNAVTGSTAYLRMYDGTTGTTGYFTKTVTGGVVPYSDGVAGNEGEELVEIARPNTVTVRLELTDTSFGHAPTSFFFRIEDSTNTPAIVDAADYEYRTGVDALVQQIFDRQRTVFTRFGLTLAERGDLTGDGLISFADITAMLGIWGGSGPADLNGDGRVSFSDLTIVLIWYGSTCVEPGC